MYIQYTMVKSQIIQVRLKPIYQERLRTAMKIMGITEISEGVRQLIDIGLSFYKSRQKRIDFIRKEMDLLNVKPLELGITPKRKYLGR